MANIIPISKSSEIFKEINSFIKTSKPSEMSIVFDLDSLALIKELNIRVKYFIFVNDISYKEQAQGLIDDLSSYSDACYSISNKTFEALSIKDNYIGLLAYIYLPEYIEKDYLFTVILDGLENPGNIGTIYRTCDAAGVDLIINTDLRANINSHKVMASSRGMLMKINTLNLSYEKTQEYLKKHHITPYLGEPYLGKQYDELAYSGKIAIVVGSERFGINNDFYNHNHEKVYIPMIGKMKCLNVGVAASILIYEASKKKNNFKKD